MQSIVCAEINALVKPIIGLDNLLTMPYTEYVNMVKTLIKVKFGVLKASQMNKEISKIIPIPRDRIALREKIRNDEDLTNYVSLLHSEMLAGNEVPFLTLDDVVSLKKLPRALSDNSVRKYCESALMFLSKYIRAMVNRRLHKMLVRNNDIDAEDIVSKVYMATYDRCRDAVMTKRGQYLVNYLKLKINSEILNIQGYYFSDKRSVVEKIEVKGNKKTGTSENSADMKNKAKTLHNLLEKQDITQDDIRDIVQCDYLPVKQNDELGSEDKTFYYNSRIVNEYDATNDNGEELDYFNCIPDTSMPTVIENNEITYKLEKKLVDLKQDDATKGERLSARILEIVMNKSEAFLKYCSNKAGEVFHDTLNILERCGRVSFLHYLKDYMGVSLETIQRYSRKFKALVI